MSHVVKRMSELRKRELASEAFRGSGIAGEIISPRALSRREKRNPHAGKRAGSG